MNKLALLTTFIFAIVFTIQVESQSFNFEPGEVVTEYVELESYKNIQVDILHPDFDDITFGWVTVENNMLEKWEYTSCDNGGCYTLLPDSATVGPLADTVPGFIRITVNPRDQVGTSTVLIYVYDIKYPDQGKIVTFEIIADSPTSIDVTEATSIEVFPNPATHFLTFDNNAAKVSKVVMTDLAGKTVFQDFIHPLQSKSISLASYPKGLYFVRLDQNETRKIIIQ